MEHEAVTFHALDLAQRLDFSLRSPAPFFVTGEEALQLSALNSATGVTLALSGRFMQLDGQVTSFTHTLIPTTDRVVSTAERSLGDGWILNFEVHVTAGTPLIGQCWARVQVQRGLGGATMPIGALVSGYVTATQPIAFPAGRVRGSLEGAGVVRSVAGAAPAAGADFSVTVPTGARWRLYSVIASFVTSIAVANREMVLVIDDGATELARIPQGVAQVASLTRAYSFYEAAERNTIAQAGAFTAALPIVPLLAGSRIRSAVANIDAADQFGAPQVLVEEWIEGA